MESANVLIYSIRSNSLEIKQRRTFIVYIIFCIVRKTIKLVYILLKLVYTVQSKVRKTWVVMKQQSAKTTEAPSIDKSRQLICMHVDLYRYTKSFLFVVQKEEQTSSNETFGCANGTMNYHCRSVVLIVLYHFYHLSKIRTNYD